MPVPGAARASACGSNTAHRAARSEVLSPGSWDATRRRRFARTCGASSSSSKPVKWRRLKDSRADEVTSMKALCWYGTNDVRVEKVPDPKILNPRDAVIKVTLTAICGSDLHLYDGFIPTMRRGDILGHEFMGEVVEVGPGNEKLKRGDRVVVPFTISCGHCFFCERD